MASDVQILNGDRARRATMDTRTMEWTPSPSRSVSRKRLHMVGGAESGQVTSVVRYEPGSSFPAHDHPEGEEILVLEGTFSDEHGDWPAGTHLLNPEGFRHAPFSRDGCILFVKLRQYAGAGRSYRKTDTSELPWQSTETRGVEAKTLYDERGFPDRMRLERWAAGAAPGARALAGGIEIFVIEGSLEDAEGRYGAGAWLRLPDGQKLDARSPDGCILYAKSGAVSSLREWSGDI
jgi:anti-sigma factor ChrR (cupin superfamily)